MTLPRAYLDSNVLINFTWWWYSKKRADSREVAQLAKAIESTAFEPVISTFGLWELAAHFRDYEISKQVTNDGYSYRQFSERRKYYSLDETARGRVRSRVRRFERNPYVSLMTVTRLGKRALAEIARFVAADIEIVDAFHLQAAVSSRCDYLVTGDEEFRRRIKQLSAEGGPRPPTKPASLREFLALPAIGATLGGAGRTTSNSGDPPGSSEAALFHP